MLGYCGDDGLTSGPDRDGDEGFASPNRPKLDLRSAASSPSAPPVEKRKAADKTDAECTASLSPSPVKLRGFWGQEGYQRGPDLDGDELFEFDDEGNLHRRRDAESTRLRGYLGQDGYQRGPDLDGDEDFVFDDEGKLYKRRRDTHKRKAEIDVDGDPNDSSKKKSIRTAAESASTSSRRNTKSQQDQSPPRRQKSSERQQEQHRLESSSQDIYETASEKEEGYETAPNVNGEE